MDGLWNGLKFGLFLVVLAGLIIYGYQVAQEQLEPPPCSIEGFPGRCYHVQPGVCESVWSKARIECEAFVKKFSFAPGRLVGPAIVKCQHARFAEAFPYSRRSNPECDELHIEMEGWRRRNPK